ncbi:carboxyl transferase domain-containing protein [Aeromicrobium sp. CF3.5]|uniref:carboxyl transferase domain-containing protein n=1 Tax=Aeromicrobium sp. CF3.5 TaxID=3373078 RepID=UPI003EE605F7
MTARPSVRELIAIVLDADSFESWDTSIDISHHPEPYRRELEAAATRSGFDESVLTGRGLMRGRPVAIIANEFRFLGGSIGVAAADRITSAIRRATAEGLPILATTSSGGTRMQEGTPAFLRMVEISRAIMDHRATGLPYLVHLRHPTTGGVFASWGSLGHITVAEPGALIGFLGPKVYELLNDRAFPPGVQVAENLANKGIIDAVVSTEDLAVVVDRALSLLVDPAKPGSLTPRTGDTDPSISTWQSILLTREPARPGVREILRHGGEDTVRLHGTDEGERDSAMLIALTRLDGQPCVVVGQDRRRQTPAAPMGPAALREARRGMRLANELGLPLVSFIDTPGADIAPAAEEKSIAGEIARCLATMATMKVPTVSVLLGQGCGGGALALVPAHRVIAAEHAWLSPLPPEGASAIVYGDTDHAEVMAESQKVGSRELLQSGSVHQVVPETPSAIEDPEGFSTALAAAIGHQLRDLISTRSP